MPAERFELSPVDRIFVRMGAKDQIMAGHSTFLTELLETASMLVRVAHWLDFFKKKEKKRKKHARAMKILLICLIISLLNAFFIP